MALIHTVWARACSVYKDDRSISSYRFIKINQLLTHPQKTNKDFFLQINEVMLQYFLKELNHFHHTTINILLSKTIRKLKNASLNILEKQNFIRSISPGANKQCVCLITPAFYRMFSDWALMPIYISDKDAAAVASLCASLQSPENKILRQWAVVRGWGVLSVITAKFVMTQRLQSCCWEWQIQFHNSFRWSNGTAGSSSPFY